MRNRLRYNRAKWSKHVLWLTLMVAVPVASHAATIVYDVNIPIGNGDITGTITTDGSLGVISFSDIVAFNLSSNDTNNGVASFNVNSGNAGLLNDSDAGNVLSATANVLSFDFLNTTLSYLEFNLNTTPTLSVIFADNTVDCTQIVPAPGCVVVGALGVGPFDGTTPTTDVIGTVASPVPEPDSLALFGSGLFGLAGAVRRRMKK